MPLVIFSGGSACKESACNVGDLGSIPGLSRSPWRKERLPNPVFWPGEFHGLYSSWDPKQMDTTEWLSLHFTIHKKGNKFYGNWLNDMPNIPWLPKPELEPSPFDAKSRSSPLYHPAFLCFKGMKWIAAVFAYSASLLLSFGKGTPTLLSPPSDHLACMGMTLFHFCSWVSTWLKPLYCHNVN